MSETLSLDGHVAECGVFRGHNTYHYANLLSELAPDKIIYAFDTFRGLPKDVPDCVDLKRFDDVQLQEVKHLLSPFSNVVLCQGLFEETFHMVQDKRFCCVILDCDLYKSYLVSLEFFYPLLISNGVFILDEYYSDKYPLARLAVDEFCKNIPEKPEKFHIEVNGWERWRIVKQ